MKIDTQIVNKLAHLSRLEFNDAEKVEMANNLEKILDWMDKLNEVNTDGVEPLRHISAEINVFREDVAINRLSQAEALSNAPEHDSDYFRVPKVID